MTCIITIELGTNNVRIFAYDINGSIIGSSKGYCPSIQPEADYNEQDPEQVLVTVLYVLKKLLNEKIHPKNYKVRSICFSACMHSLIITDARGNAIGNALTWADNRAKTDAEKLKNTAAGRYIYNQTGTPIHPMSPLVKIAWIKQHNKQQFEKAAKFISLKTYIIQQLTGECVMDYSIASATGLFNIHTIHWEASALNYAGISAEQLPDAVSVYQVVGKLKKVYQNALVLSADTRIIVGSSDGCMATLGDGLPGIDKASITIEDSGAVRVMGNQPLQDKQQCFFNYLLTENIFISGGPTNNGGVIFEWYTKLYGDFDKPFDIERSMQSLILEAFDVPAGSEGLLFLPYLLGERAPLWNANARGAYIGLNIKHEKKHFVRALIEGIMYEIYSIGKKLEEQQSFKHLCVNGSFASNHFCAQILSDLFNKPVYVRPTHDSVSFGSFMIAACEMGIYKTLDDAAYSLPTPIARYPSKKNNIVYSETFQVFEALTQSVARHFNDIVQLQTKKSTINQYLFTDN